MDGIVAHFVHSMDAAHMNTSKFCTVSSQVIIRVFVILLTGSREFDCG
jgi:hypothetical protein